MLVGMGRAPEQPRWLSDEEQQVWRGFLAVNQLLFDALDRQLQAEAGMPHAYYILLAVLSEAPERALRMSELAEISNSSQSRISHAVARLEEAGWVRRRKVDRDRRGERGVRPRPGGGGGMTLPPGGAGAGRGGLFGPFSR